jgi:hypothetical protein
VSLIGYRALKDFNKFKFNGEEIIFKRTSLLYQLYLFLAYFGILTILLILLTKRHLFDTGQFVKNIYRMAFLKDRNARM